MQDLKSEWGRSKYSADNDRSPDDGALFFRGLINGLGLMAAFWLIVWLVFCSGPHPGAKTDGASPSTETGTPAN